MINRITEDIAAVAVEYSDQLIDIGAEASNRMPPGSRYRFARKHTFTLANGERVDGEVRAMTKPKLAKRIESEKLYVSKGCVFASQWNSDRGPYWSTSTRVVFSLG